MRRGQRHAAWLAWGVFGLTMAMAVGTAAFAFVDEGTVLPEDSGVTVGGPGELGTMQATHVSLWLRPEAGR